MARVGELYLQIMDQFFGRGFCPTKI